MAATRRRRTPPNPYAEALARVQREKRRREEEIARHKVEQRGEELREQCSTLPGFIRWAWPILEPGTAYQHNWHIDCISDHLHAIVAGDLQNLAINIPPGFMKSLLVSVFFPAYWWTTDATKRFLSGSYEQTLALRDNEKMRALVTSAEYEALWGEKTRLIKTGVSSFMNVSRGGREARAYASMTGGRGDVTLIDDPHSTIKAESDEERTKAVRQFQEGIQNRVNDAMTSAIIVIMQRLHAQDISGAIDTLGLDYERLVLPMELEERRRCYTVVRPTYIEAPQAVRFIRLVSGETITAKEARRLQALEPVEGEQVDSRLEGLTALRGEDGSLPWREGWSVDPRKEEGELLFEGKFPAAAVVKLKKVGSYAWAGQYQQRPTPREGGMFKREWFAGKIIPASRLPAGIVWWRHWDLADTDLSPNATKGARTCGVKMGKAPDGTLYVGDMKAAGVSGGKTRKLIKSVAEVDGYGVNISIPQDPGSAGKVVAVDYVTLLQGWNVRKLRESQLGDKVQRAEPLSAQCEVGNVFLVEGPWNAEYLEELCQFPGGARKDVADASSGAFSRLVRPQKSTEEELAPPVVIGN